MSATVSILSKVPIISFHPAREESGTLDSRHRSTAERRNGTAASTSLCAEPSSALVIPSHTGGSKAIGCSAPPD